MAVDLKRLAAAAADAALSDERPAELNGDSKSTHRGGFGGVRGVAAGAVLVAAARFAAKRGPSAMSLVEHLPKPDLSELGDRMRDRIDDWFGEEDDYEADDRDEDEAEWDDDDSDEA